MKRVGDIYSAVDYLTSLPYVDASRIGALGICAGSGADDQGRLQRAAHQGCRDGERGRRGRRDPAGLGRKAAVADQIAT